ncbi:hypothetical protein [Chromobacterium piscinae]|uniref:hypothetical protein n=1 Tax=Chromobacterium piscinae TaxID=686831 RepID=UPI0032614AF4
MTRLRSLQARLMLVLLLIVPATWLAASAAAVWLAQREVDELTPRWRSSPASCWR